MGDPGERVRGRFRSKTTCSVGLSAHPSSSCFGSSSLLPALPPALFFSVETTLRTSTTSSNCPSPQGHPVSPPQIFMELTLTWPCARSVRTNLGPEAASRQPSAVALHECDKLEGPWCFCVSRAATDLEPPLVLTLAPLIRNQATGWEVCSGWDVSHALGRELLPTLGGESEYCSP